MNFLLYEHVIGIICLLLSTFFFVFVIHRKNRRSPVILVILAAFLGLFGLLMVIHFFFCFHIHHVGFPLSATQETEETYGLTASNWLSFIGSYLGFAGSLIMSFLIYHQSRIINDYTISEYAPSIGISVHDCLTQAEVCNYNQTSILQVDREGREHYAFFCDLVSGAFNNRKEAFESIQVLVYTEIQNHSKSTITRIKFIEIELNEINNPSSCFTYNNRGGIMDPVSEGLCLYPKESVNLCFVLNQIPREMKISWMTIRFQYDKKLTIEVKKLFSKVTGEAMTFSNISIESQLGV